MPAGAPGMNDGLQTFKRVIRTASWGDKAKTLKQKEKQKPKSFTYGVTFILWTMDTLPFQTGVSRVVLKSSFRRFHRRLGTVTGQSLRPRVGAGEGAA